MVLTSLDAQVLMSTRSMVCQRWENIWYGLVCSRYREESVMIQRRQGNLQRIGFNTALQVSQGPSGSDMSGRHYGKLLVNLGKQTAGGGGDKYVP